MILSDEEIKTYLDNSDCPCLANSHLEANARIRELEAKLRELAEAAEWRDDLAGFYASTRNRPHMSKNGWWDNFYMENCRKADAEAAYQAALKAAKEE